MVKKVDSKVLKRIAIWLLLFLVIISEMMLYKGSNWFDFINIWLDRLVLVIPALIIFLLAMVWAINSEKAKVWKVIGGGILAIASSIYIAHEWISKIKEKIEWIEDHATSTLFIIIGSAAILLAALSYKKPV